jgi:sigma-B regulation protein RsbU (phosphoserine phosphatase)
MSQQHNDETRKLAEISALEVESSRAENEADTLRLTNQRMILTVIIWGFIILTIILVLYIRRRLIQMRQLKAAYDQLEAVTAQKERIESELRIARDIQMAMVPSNFSLREDVDIYANMTPAKAVGGDLYDIFIIDDHLYFCIGDVSGKGVPAALFMAVSMSLFRAYSAEEVQPDRIVARMNKSLCERNKKHMFVTMFVGILDLKSGELCYCNAGHEAPLIIDKEVRELPVIRNLPVGAVKKATYQMQTTTIEPQSTILLYTDGLSEAMDADKQMYGRERIVEEVERACQAGQYVPKTLIEQLTQSVHSFVGDTEQSDDITMIALSRKK